MTKNWLIKTGEKKPAVTDKKKELASRQSSFAQKVQAMRVATGKVESRRVYFKCASTSGGFYADFERTNPAERFKIARIEKEVPAAEASGFAAGLAASLSAKRSRTNSVFECSEMDSQGLYCPWCNAKGGFVHCTDCGGNVCRGRTMTRADGTDWFTCDPTCGATGTLGPLKEVHGDTAPRRHLLPAAKVLQRKALPGTAAVSRQQLPGGNRGLLEGPKR